MSNVMKTIDLFAGIGGIRKGFEQTGLFETVYANDFDKFCKLTYDLNFDKVPLTIKDIRKVSLRAGDIPYYDFLLAGFPCQPFSVGSHGKGFDDAKGRGTMFEEIERILRETEEVHGQKPMGFLLENVKNLQSHDQGKTFKVIYQKLVDLGYTVEYKVYNSLQFGVAQSRERMYIVGFLNPDVMERFMWPQPTHTSPTSVFEILDKQVDGRHYYNGKPLYSRIKDEVLNDRYVYVYRRNHVRAHKQGYAPTLVASMGLGGHNVPIIKDNKGIRRLSPTECARLQGYHNMRVPLHLADQQIYKQIGNSVTVPVIRAIANNIADAVYDKKAKSPRIAKQTAFV